MEKESIKALERILGTRQTGALGALLADWPQLYNWQPGKMHRPAKVGRVKHILAISMKVRGGGGGEKRLSIKSRHEH